MTSNVHCQCLLARKHPPSVHAVDACRTEGQPPAGESHHWTDAIREGDTTVGKGVGSRVEANDDGRTRLRR